MRHWLRRRALPVATLRRKTTRNAYDASMYSTKDGTARRLSSTTIVATLVPNAGRRLSACDAQSVCKTRRGAVSDARRGPITADVKG